MPLLANARLGHYEIKSVLGVGGMGEVYRARDTRLNRDVAIKVLHEDGATSADQRSRFEREARALAALNHPNIVVVYDFGVEAGQQYIASELIEGESLRSLLNGKPVAARKLLDIAAQVADGLAAAHAAGIIHRDLKPENIMLTREGRVKILDFGLARHTTASGIKAADADLEPTSAPDATKHHTHEGAVMGTASYMSPEQALGKPVDFRTDQFSFGLILYELASGKRAFARSSAVETMAAIVRDDPPPLEEKLPAPFKWIIERCLAKEPEQRYESTRDLYRDLRNLRDHFSEAYTSGALEPFAPRKKGRSWAIPTAVGVACLLTALLGYLLKPSGQDIVKYRYTPFANYATAPVWSPDGKAVAYSGRVNGVNQAFLRYLNSPVALQLTHEKHDVGVKGWSSDRSHLILIEDTGGNESRFQKLYSVPTVGGNLDFIMDADCIACDLSRDGKAFATLARSKDSGDTYWVAVSDPLGSPLRTYLPAPFATREIYSQAHLSYSPDGKKILLFRAGENRKEEAWLLPYPAGNKPPYRILQRSPSFQGNLSFSWFPDDLHIAVSLAGDRDSPAHLWIADTESGDLTPLTTGNAYEILPSVAPDGKSLFYIQWAANVDVVSVSVEDGSAKTLVSTGWREDMAAWSAKTEKLAWVTNRSGACEIWIRGPDQTDRPVVTRADFPDGFSRCFMHPSLSPDGERLIFSRVSDNGGARLWMMSLAGGTPVRVTNNNEEGAEFGCKWSPDGDRYLYHRYLAGKTSLMIVRTSGDAAPIELKEDAGSLSDWSPVGDWITYRNEAGWNLISADGKTSKFLGKVDSDFLAFSKDGKLLYGIQTGDSDVDRDRVTLFSLDPVTLKEKAIKDLGADLRPSSQINPGIRFSLAPDGKSIVYSTKKTTSDLWMLQGYRQPGWLSQFSGILK